MDSLLLCSGHAIAMNAVPLTESLTDSLDQQLSKSEG